MKVSLFIPCFVDQIYPETGFNVVKLLQKAGCEVHYNPAQTCCGQPAFNAGFWDQTRPVCEKFIRDFADADYIVSPSGSCVGFIRNFYSDLFENSALHNECKELQRSTFELTEFLVDVLHVTDFGARFDAVATYHDACGALRECKIREAPRTLLSKVKGLELLEMNESETCCGFGGTFAVKFDDISSAMAEQKTTNSLATHADYIVSTDLSCLLHIDGFIKKQKAPIKIMHIADVLTMGW